MPYKIKGFTLVELIVVIAIISVLSSVLIPNIAAYARDSKKKEAIGNAEAIFRATQDWLTEQEIDNRKLFPSTSNQPSTAYIRFDSTTATAGKGQIKSGGITGIDFDIQQYLGDMISKDGYWCAVINVEDYECLRTVWVQSNDSLVTGENIIGFGTYTEYSDYVKENGVIGAYPFTDSAS